MRNRFRGSRLLASVALALLLGARAASGQVSNPNTIEFQNKSGQAAVVRLVGPSGQRVSVPDKSARTVRVAPGVYQIVVRYGDTPGNYSYVKGASFAVEQSETQYSELVITLHRVRGGNYATRPATAADFGR